MNRAWFILILLILIGLGALFFLWTINPLLILVPCGIGFILFLLTFLAFIRAAELTTFADWDLLIRSLLHRLGFQIQPPKSLIHDHDLSEPENWEHHHHNHEHEEH